jgi:hypothetical protein
MITEWQENQGSSHSLTILNKVGIPKNIKQNYNSKHRETQAYIGTTLHSIKMSDNSQCI